MIPESERSGDDAISAAMRMMRGPPFEGPRAAALGKLLAAQAAARAFLADELGAREGRVTKLVPGGQGSSGWTAEAEILVPNLEVKKLGLPLSQEVLELERYALELNADLNVVSYELLGADAR
jgi:hypothetical protein